MVRADIHIEQALACLLQFGPNFDARERLITDCPRIIA
jgi:hypothetical protein